MYVSRIFGHVSRYEIHKALQFRDLLPRTPIKMYLLVSKSGQGVLKINQRPMVSLGAGLVHRREDPLPGTPHFLGVIKTLAIVAVQGSCEEGRQGVAHGGIEERAIQRDLTVQYGRIGLAIAPLWQNTGGHLVQGHGNGKALSV